MNRLGIEMISVFGLSPVDFIHLAADLGCAHISTALISIGGSPHGYSEWSLKTNRKLRQETMAALRERGISISLGEGFSIRPNLDARRDRAADLELMSELGVKRVNTVSLEPDLGRSFDQFSVLAEMAAAAGMETTLEFGPGLAVGDLSTALSAIRHVGRPDFRLLIDTMHLVRSGASAEELARIPPDMIGYIQLGDAPLISRHGSYMEEAMFERMAPGAGELPLLDILAALPRDRVIGLEIPQRSQVQAGVGPHERLGRCVTAARELLAQLP